ncbi:MAG: hypothetical protein ACE5FJ_01905 [Gemmatimonadales bacterium]
MMKSIFLAGRVGIALALSSCARVIPSIAPVGLESIDRSTVIAWVDEFRVESNRLISIRPWRYVNERGTAAGRAMVRLVPPDSMRFDYRGPFGKSGGAVIFGTRAAWAHPEGDFDALIAVAPVFWAAVGHPPVPPFAATFRGMDTADLRVWQYEMGGDTLTFIAEGRPTAVLRGEVRRAGRTLAVSRVTFDPATRYPVTAQVDFPQDPGRFTFEVQSVEVGAEFGRGVWNEP